MDPLAFVAAVIDAIAWPLVAVIIFLALRRPLFNLIPLIERLRYRDLEIGFNTQVEQLAFAAREALPAHMHAEEEDRRWHENLQELAQLSPRAVVLEAWLDLEREAIETSRRYGLNLSSWETRAPILLGHALEQAGILDDTTQEIFYRLKNLRNAAAHASDFAFTPDSALEYADLAYRLTEHLRRAQPAPEPVASSVSRHERKE